VQNTLAAGRPRLALVLVLTVALLAAPHAALAHAEDADGAHPAGTLKPSYEPAPPPEPQIYTTDYYFAMTRGVAGSTIVPAGKVPLFFLTVPLDLFFLPISMIAGFFPGDPAPEAP
jgi:hypothetical protein